MEEVGELIGNVGFPIFIATYVIMKLEPTIRKNTEILKELKSLVRKLNGG